MKIKNIIIFIFIAQISAPIFSAQTQTNMNTNTIANGAFLQEFYDQEKSNQETVKKIQPPSPFWTTVKIILYTAVFGVAAYFVVRFIVSKSSLPFTGDANIIETLMTKPMGMGSYLQIVKVGASYYILGLSNEGLRMIDKIQDQETIDYIELNKEKIKPKETKFLDILSYLPLSKKTDKMEFLKNQKNRLKKL